MVKGEDDVINLFRAAADALERQDWLAAAMLCDPISLAAFKRQLVERVDPERKVASITIDQLMRHQPDLPLAVAEYQVSKHEQSYSPESVWAREVAGVPDISTLRRMSPAEVFAAHLGTNSIDHQVERLRTLPVADDAVEYLLSRAAPVPKYAALGAVYDGDRMAYVIYRLQYVAPANGEEDSGTTQDWTEGLSPDERELAMDVAEDPPQCASCRRQSDGTWRLVADHGFLGTGNMAFGIGYDEDAVDPAGDG